MARSVRKLGDSGDGSEPPAPTAALMTIAELQALTPARIRQLPPAPAETGRAVYCRSMLIVTDSAGPRAGGFHVGAVAVVDMVQEGRRREDFERVTVELLTSYVEWIDFTSSAPPTIDFLAPGVVRVFHRNYFLALTSGEEAATLNVQTFQALPLIRTEGAGTMSNIRPMEFSARAELGSYNFSLSRGPGAFGGMPRDAIAPLETRVRFHGPHPLESRGILVEDFETWLAGLNIYADQLREAGILKHPPRHQEE